MNGAFDFRKWWPAPLLPAGDGRNLSLMFVVAALSFLASLAAIGALAGERAAEGWRSELTGSATVVVRAQGDQTPDAAAARAVEVLSGVKGVSEARALEKEKAEALLAPWIGPGVLPPDLPVPRLVTLELDRKAPATADQLRHALAGAAIDATVDDHSLWTKDIVRAGVMARGIALGLMALIVAALAAVIAFATGSGLEARRDIVEALHLSGATDSFIARLFQARFARTATQAGLLGAVLAVAAAIALKLLGGGAGLAAVAPIAWRDLAAPASIPLLGALVAAITARLTAMAHLRDHP